MDLQEIAPHLFFLNTKLLALFIHKQLCISPQQTFGEVDFTSLKSSIDGKMIALEPTMTEVPAGMLRRMSKAVRMGIGAALPLIKETTSDGIIIGTANGGMEDCIKFLNQIIDYDEGLLTPGNFVQSTPNALAGQLSLITKNRGYNATHVHLGLAFENALLDTQLLLNENPELSYLVGAVDEISTYNYNIDYLARWYDKTLTSATIYTANQPATIAGEGSAMFIASAKKQGALAEVKHLYTLHTHDAERVMKWLEEIKNNLADTTNTLLISGENGDTRMNPFYQKFETVFSKLPLIRFKHLIGEYPTASSFALWLANEVLNHNIDLLPLLKSTSVSFKEIKQIIIYNNYQGKQHSCIVISKIL